MTIEISDDKLTDLIMRLRAGDDMNMAEARWIADLLELVQTIPSLEQELRLYRNLVKLAMLDEKDLPESLERRLADVNNALMGIIDADQLLAGG